MLHAFQKKAFIRGRILPEAGKPVNRFLIWVYRPIIAGVMRWKKLTILLAFLTLVLSIYPASGLGSEVMPTLNEGTLLYMPTSPPKGAQAIGMRPLNTK